MSDFLNFIFSIIIGIAAIIGMPILVIYTLFEYDRRFPIISFKSFKKFYTLNPSRWHCSENYVRCMVDGYDFECFSFSILGFYKYRLWCKAQEKNKRKEKYNESIQRMMSAVKKDMEKLEGNHE